MYKKIKKIFFTSVDNTENNKIIIWKKFRKAIQKANEMKLPYVGIYLSKDALSAKNIKINSTFINVISQANMVKTNILYCNAAKNIKTIIPLDDNLLWIDHIEYTDVLIIYNRFYDMILSCENISDELSFEESLSLMTSNKLLMFPMKGGDVSVDTQLNNRIIKLLRMKSELCLISTSLCK